MGRVAINRIEVHSINAETATGVVAWTINYPAKMVPGVTMATVRKFPEGWKFVAYALSIPDN
jgi:hypothetical protein